MFKFFSLNIKKHNLLESVVPQKHINTNLCRKNGSVILWGKEYLRDFVTSYIRYRKSPKFGQGP